MRLAAYIYTLARRSGIFVQMSAKGSCIEQVGCRETWRVLGLGTTGYHDPRMYRVFVIRDFLIADSGWLGGDFRSEGEIEVPLSICACYEICPSSMLERRRDADDSVDGLACMFCPACGKPLI